MNLLITNCHWSKELSVPEIIEWRQKRRHLLLIDRDLQTKLNPQSWLTHALAKIQDTKL